MSTVVCTPKPDSVQFDYHANQLHEPNPNDPQGRWPRYLPCSGCGWSIGVSDAPAEVMYNECLALQPAEVQAAFGLPA